MAGSEINWDDVGWPERELASAMPSPAALLAQLECTAARVSGPGMWLEEGRQPVGRPTAGSEVPVADAGSRSTSFLQILPTTPVCQASLQLPAVRSARTALRFTPQELMPFSRLPCIPQSPAEGPLLLTCLVTHPTSPAFTASRLHMGLVTVGAEIQFSPDSTAHRSSLSPLPSPGDTPHSPEG